jgi:hypothetical protein
VGELEVGVSECGRAGGDAVTTQSRAASRGTRDLVSEGKQLPPLRSTSIIAQGRQSLI